MSKKITIIGINYYPEDSAIGLYTTQKAEYLVKNGFDVTVITGFPYYPQWKIRDDYKSRGKFLKEKINGVKILRSKQYVPSKPTFSKRIIHLISFTFGNFINLFKIHKPDIVIAIIPFTTSALLGWFLKKRYKSKLWIHIQDFEFDAAIDSGLLNGNKKHVINMLLYLEKAILNKADVISTISHGMTKKLKNKITPKETFYLTNWIDKEKFNTLTTENHPYLSSDKFKILYSGNIGEKQDWDFFFSFLNHLKPHTDIEVIVVGEGSDQEKVKHKINEYNVNFVKHYNLVEFSELPGLLNSANLHILFQKEDVIDTVMPSKILGMMASAKPSIITGNLNSEVKSIIEKSKGGFYFDSKNIKPIIDTILYLQKDNTYANELGNNARDYVFKNYTKTNVLNQLIEKLNTL